METSRIWHEPEVVIYSVIITPGISSSGEAYDLANRRWYQINVTPDTYDEDWMANMIEEHISTYYHKFGKQTPFNTINSTQHGLLEFDTKPNDVIARPIKEKLKYQPLGETTISVVPFDHLVDKVYLGRAIDRCRWKDQDCAFKRIEFDCDVKAIDREIKSREALLEVVDRFNVIPILAVVVSDQGGDTGNVVGVLMPFGGLSLESLSEIEPNSVASISVSKDLGITRRELRDLARGVRELVKAGVIHGDINERNTLRWPRETIDGKEYQERNRLLLVDFGDVAPEYKSDAFALGELFIWCKERSSWDVSDQLKVGEAAQVLKENGDLDLALSILDDERNGHRKKGSEMGSSSMNIS